MTFGDTYIKSFTINNKLYTSFCYVEDTNSLFANTKLKSIQQNNFINKCQHKPTNNYTKISFKLKYKLLIQDT